MVKSIKTKLMAFLKMGMTPEQLALSIGLGIALGMVPALGMATLLCTLAALLFRLNLPAIQLTNILVYPLQLALLIPFLHAGEWLFGAESLNLSVDFIQRMLKENLWKTVIGLWAATMRAVVVWLLVAPVVVALVYIILTPILRKLRLDRLAPVN